MPDNVFYDSVTCVEVGTQKLYAQILSLKSYAGFTEYTFLLPKSCSVRTPPGISQTNRDIHIMLIAHNSLWLGYCSYEIILSCLKN